MIKEIDGEIFVYFGKAFIKVDTMEEAEEQLKIYHDLVFYTAK